MTDLKDRGDNFEKKFAHDAELKFKAEARRNKMLGHWAAEKLGRDAEEYATEVIRADFEEAGDEDVYRKVMGDFTDKGVVVSEDELRGKMHEFLAKALEQVQAE